MLALHFFIFFLESSVIQAYFMYLFLGDSSLIYYMIFQFHFGFNQVKLLNLFDVCYSPRVL